MKLINEYLEYLEIEKGRSRKTIDNYGRYLARFLKFSQVLEPAHITDEIVRKYRLWLNRENLNRRTQNYHLIALRGFLKYLVRRGVQSLSPEVIELAKTEERYIDMVDADDLDRLLKAPAPDMPERGSPQAKLERPALHNSLMCLRDKALLELLFSTGLRVSELCSLDRDTVNPKKVEFSIRGKGGKIRVVFVSEDTRVALKEYLDKRGDVAPALFVSAPRGSSVSAKMKEPSRLTPRTVQRIIKHYAIKAGISKKVTPHTLRHMFATDLLINGADIRSVQQMLGHANVATTQVYTHITDRQLRDVHTAFHGRQRKKK
ncbi:MAG: hypothetical protein A3J54_04580 [Candidatus Ryanbacteria bacterium RIFCSPHIGHO2_02_FULL_45_13b]|uniref:Tyrosine recombinase XerC n=1 Tax=Candidatus Ryanbacteria bacterium RIFCSPHIGHO2_02_FULL_45_13b TaxID=1802117 RepID=A0A1G2G4E4_9BACT|nr:MAG: hypothetical protein A3J54_04580 [Candidatus Ryanbacteria bacterium RIFCSPHIGHO2_02_FULL_45_13b]